MSSGLDHHDKLTKPGKLFFDRAWPTCFFIFERQPLGTGASSDGDSLCGVYGGGQGGGALGKEADQWVLAYRSRPTHEALIEVTDVLRELWANTSSAQSMGLRLPNQGGL